MARFTIYRTRTIVEQYDFDNHDEWDTNVDEAVDIAQQQYDEDWKIPPQSAGFHQGLGYPFKALELDAEGNVIAAYARVGDTHFEPDDI